MNQKDYTELFIEKLGWDYLSQRQLPQACTKAGLSFIAEKRGVIAFYCDSDLTKDEKFAIVRIARQQYYESFVIFSDYIACKYATKQVAVDGNFFDSIKFSFDEEESLRLFDVIARINNVFQDK